MISVIAASAIGILLYLNYTDKTSEPPIYNPADFNPELVHFSLRNVTKDHRVGPFELINQFGEPITQVDYANKIFVTDFFFTRCPSICPIMTNNMVKIQQHFIEEPKVALLSISVTPEYDSIPILDAYAAKNGVVPEKWNVCTGKKNHIYKLARRQFFAVTDEGDGALQEFIHTPNFILVDAQRRIRGIYDGTQDEEINRVIRDIEALLY